MDIKPNRAFRAVVAGSAYPQFFSTEDEFAPDSEAAKTALELGCLTEEDQETVKAALGLGDAQTSAAAEKAAAEKAAAEKAAAEKKSQGAAPENKTGGAKD